jgi:two-component system sensor histidine kinase LytS
MYRTKAIKQQLKEEQHNRTEAELEWLKNQLNPHFLFNTLNTIAALTRTDPNKARDLLRDFSVFYRRTLEASETLIPLDQELEQTRRYLTIEQARFGEDRIVESEHVEPGLEEVRVPSFLVQPIVENSVRHAMRDEGPLHIDVHVATDGSDVLIAVADDGLGMDDAVADRLLKQAKAAEGNERGTGIALRNVAERIERFYGVGSGIEIMSKLGQGTVVTLRLGDAVPTDMDGMVRL